jgi:hypothetical protein
MASFNQGNLELDIDDQGTEVRISMRDKAADQQLGPFVLTKEEWNTDVLKDECGLAWWDYDT